MEPTVLSDCPDDCILMREEIFGPILPVKTFHDLDAVIADINSRDKPLALYVFGKHPPTIEKILRQTSAGGGCINHIGLQFLHGNLPFGGAGHSGIGKTKGRFGLLAFSNERAVVHNRFLPGSLLFAL